MKFKISETLSTIKAYEAGKPLAEVEREYKIQDIIKLASNENPLGFSPRVHDAVNAHMRDMNRYPESSGYLLKNKLAQKFKVSPDHIVLGNGSDDIIALLCHGFLNPGDEAVMPLPSFLMYEISVKTAKGRPVMVPLVDFSTNLNGIIEKILGDWVKGKTVVADTEFDAEERFHEKVIWLGGKGVAPLRHKDIPLT